MKFYRLETSEQVGGCVNLEHICRTYMPMDVHTCMLASAIHAQTHE